MGRQSKRSLESGKTRLIAFRAPAPMFMQISSVAWWNSSSIFFMAATTSFAHLSGSAVSWILVFLMAFLLK
eukprot:CAMPEP_0183578364 /NCGR_PEP_ID=MMETSP0371-20130417/141690_1 /TAXON_ID=268820 /ORGANISM="Peridinium aciculiferum, Strain PAER-2" /LENGTH=70 /DNA_ID=CAMNT_0025788783 /DNA_START=1 /DNA_END=213 /DNA_ORIENTATION=+